MCQGDGERDCGHCAEPSRLFTPDISVYSSRFMDSSPFLKWIFVLNPHKCLTCPWRDSGCCFLLELHCDLSLSSLVTFRASKELFAFSCSIFLSPWTPCLTFSSVPCVFSSSVSSPCIPVLTDLLLHARSGGSHAVLSIWAEQLLQSRGVSRSTLSAGAQLPHHLPDSRFSPRVLPLCWPQTPSPTQGLLSWGKLLRFLDHRAQTLQLMDFPILMDLLLHPLPLLHVEPEGKQEKYENVEVFHASAHHFERFPFCYWNTFQSADSRGISAEFFQTRFVYSLSFLADLSLKK